LAIVTTVTLASTSIALPDDGVPAPKHVGAVLISILIFNVHFKIVFKAVHLCISW